MHHREAEPGALTHILCGEERFEDAIEHVAVHADAIVAYGDLRVFARF